MPATLPYLPVYPHFIFFPYRLIRKLISFFVVAAVLLKSGVDAEVAKTSIRLSIGRETTAEDIISAAQDIHQAFLSLKTPPLQGRG